MGKRKRNFVDQETNHKTNPPLSLDNMPCSSRTELLSKAVSCKSFDSSEPKPFSSGMVMTDSSLKLLNPQSSVAHQQYNLGRSIFLKRSCNNHYGHQYSRRNSGKHSSASTSHCKVTPFHDDRLLNKLANQDYSMSRHHAEYQEKAFSRPERIRSSSLVLDAVYADAVKMVCGICQKMLRRKPYFRGDALSTGEFSVVAVLVCGHVYHADCLEQRTSPEDGRDPTCPLCLDLFSRHDTCRGHE
ncbi:zf-C3HC4_2 domain-containing protein [Cephalotus follicularis]|uniref:Zf-C3HC4_2 domain-containing protein n=1 Tax=Cephalotus follicularis TaxID=3775 RepID=A0A1Q3D9G7_CEPFO|nr:zf-C3HC4_2 domain-containing protein [Cephalotus follicularis]